MHNNDLRQIGSSILLAVALSAASLGALAQITHAQELTVEQVIELLLAAGALQEEKADEARKAVDILALERLQTLENAQCPQLNRTLSLGAQGQSVRSLQAFFAGHPHIYPEGLVTGYYGALTQAAVRRYQAGLGIVSSGSAATTGYGVVGPKTRRALANCRAPAQPRPAPHVEAPRAPQGPRGVMLGLLEPPYQGLDAVRYGELTNVYFTYFRGWRAPYINMASTDLRDPTTDRPFQEHTVVLLYHPEYPDRIMIYEPGLHEYRVLLNANVSVSRVVVLTGEGSRHLGYHDLHITTKDGATRRYRYTSEGFYSRVEE